MSTKQQAVTTESKIVRAVVYSGDRAQIFRRAEVALPPGDHTVHVDGLWSNADRSSLQVGLTKGAARTVMRAVQFTNVQTVEDVRPQVAELQKGIDKLKDDEQRLNEDIELTKAAEASYDAVQNKVVDPRNTLHEGKPLPTAYKPDQWAAISQFILKGIRDQREKRVSLTRELEKVKSEMDKLQQKLRSFGSEHVRRKNKDVAELLLTVAAEGVATDAVPIVFELSYLVQGAKWTPTYDVRINSKAKQMQLAYNANVQNATGEDWTDVRLQLSTAAATNVGTMPALRPWVIAEPQFNVQQNYQQDCWMQQEAAAPPQMMQQMMNVMPASSSMLRSAPSAPAPRSFAAAATASAAVTSQGGSSTFSVVAPTSVKSDNQPVKVAVTMLDLPVHFRYSAVPKLDPAVYLKVKAVNTTAFDLLPGRANVFSDNQLVSTTRLDKVAPGEDFWTFLGTDDDITIRRVKEPHHTLSTTGGFLSAKKKVRTYTFHYVAKNNKGTEEELVIWDQYPISKDKRLVVDRKVPSQDDTHTPCELRPIGAKQAKPVHSRLLHKVNDDQFIEWFAQMPPGQEVKFDFTFAVEHPDDLNMFLRHY